MILGISHKILKVSVKIYNLIFNITLSKHWTYFENFRYDFFPSGHSLEKEHYFHTVSNLTTVLPVGANKALLDLILMPLLNQFKEKFEEEENKDSPPELIVAAIRFEFQTLKS